MGTNNPEYQRAYKQKHYAENKARYLEQNDARRKKLKAEINELKKEPCMDCGQTYNPWQMHFDHRDGSTKVDGIARMANEGRRTAVYAEIEKCDLVCANCHADRTYQRILIVNG